MNWNRMLMINTQEIINHLRYLYRNHRGDFWAFLMQRFYQLQLMIALLVVSHVVSLATSWLAQFWLVWILAAVIDSAAMLIATYAVLNGLVQVYILFLAGAALLDGVEGVFNVVSGIARRAAQLMGKTAPVAGDEDIGLDKLKAAAQAGRIWVGGILAIHFTWCALLAYSYWVGMPLGFGARVMLFLLLLALGSFSAFANVPMAETIKRGIITAFVVAICLVLLSSFGMFTWLGIPVLFPPGEPLAGMRKYFAWGILLLLLSEAIKRLSRPVGWLTKVAAVLLIVWSVFWSAKWQEVKDQPVAEKVLPTRWAKTVNSVEEKVLTTVESVGTGTVEAASVDTTVDGGGVGPTYPWQLQNCLARPVNFKLFLVPDGPNDGSISTKMLIDSGVLAPGETRQMSNEMPKGWLIRIVAQAGGPDGFYPWDLNLVTDQQRRSVYETKMRLDPKRIWESIGQVDPEKGPLFSIGFCREGPVGD